MGTGMWIGVDGKAQKIKGLWIGVDGIARKVKKVWIGVDGKAQLCYTATTPTSITLHGGKGDTINYTYNGNTITESFSSSSTSKTITIDMVDDSASITFSSLITGFSRTVTVTAGASQIVYVRPAYSIVWYGYRDTSKSITSHVSSSSSVTILSDNTIKIIFNKDYIESGAYAGISASDPYLSGHKAYLAMQITNSDDSGYTFVHFGSASISGNSVSFSSASTTFNAAIGNYAKTVTTDASTRFAVLCDSQTALPVSVTMIVKAFAIE